MTADCRSGRALTVFIFCRSFEFSAPFPTTGFPGSERRQQTGVSDRDSRASRNRRFASGRKPPRRISIDLISCQRYSTTLSTSCTTNETLKECCLVSKSWVSRTRKHLFADIKFRPAVALELWKILWCQPGEIQRHGRLSRPIPRFFTRPGISLKLFHYPPKLADFRPDFFPAPSRGPGFTHRRD